MQEKFSNEKKDIPSESIKQGSLEQTSSEKLASFELELQQGNERLAAREQAAYKALASLDKDNPQSEQVLRGILAEFKNKGNELSEHFLKRARLLVLGVGLTMPVVAQTVEHGKEPSKNTRTLSEVVVTTEKHSYQEKLDLYNQSQANIARWRTTNILSPEQSRLQGNRFVPARMEIVPNEEVYGAWRAACESVMVPINYIKVFYSTETEGDYEYLPQYEKPKPPVAQVQKQENVQQKHEHTHKQPEVLNPYTLTELPPMYTREPLGTLDSLELEKYQKRYAEFQNELKTGERHARMEPFSIEDFPFWKEFDQSLWPKYTIYLDSKVTQDKNGAGQASPVEFFLPPVPQRDPVNHEAHIATPRVHEHRQPSQNYPYLSEVYIKDEQTGNYHFDHYEDPRGTKVSDPATWHRKD